MNIKIRAVRNFILWLFLGLAAGVFLAAVLSYHEYRTVAGIADSVLRTEGSGRDSNGDIDISDIFEESSGRDKEMLLSDVLAQCLKKDADRDPEDLIREGEAFLKRYGYYPMRNWGRYLPFTAGISVFLFQLAGWIVFGMWYREEIRIKGRIHELTGYLKAVNQGEGAVLRRSEDIFSHLEDEIYKTVMELWSTKEAAVRNHEVLAQRIADIAHQLKTPLTSMSLMTELLEEYQTGETREYYSRLSNQIERLRNLVTGLLSLAKLDSHGIVFQRERLKMPELIEAASEPLREIMEKRQITLIVEECSSVDAHDARLRQETEIAARQTGQDTVIAAKQTGQDAEECWIYADRQWTEEALLNILKNCVEHTPKKGIISALYSQNPIYTELRIEDGGGGFQAADLPHVFERFYRGKGAAKDNVGIGLALARAVIEQQNGQISAGNTVNGHAFFRIKWYAGYV